MSPAEEVQFPLTRNDFCADWEDRSRHKMLSDYLLPKGWRGWRAEVNRWSMCNYFSRSSLAQL